MYDFFINIKFESVFDILLKTVAFIAIGFILIWLINIISFNRKDKEGVFNLNNRLNINYLWSQVVFIFLLTIYMVVLYFLNGAFNFKWDNFPMDKTNTYLQLLPIILLFIGSLISFYITYSALLKKLKN